VLEIINRPIWTGLQKDSTERPSVWCGLTRVRRVSTPKKMRLQRRSPTRREKGRWGRNVRILKRSKNPLRTADI